MKRICSAGVLIAALLTASAEPAPTGSSVAAAPVEAASAKRLDNLEATVRGIEERLGRTIQKPTPTRNFERRIEGLEEAVAKLRSDLKRLETLEREQKRLEERIRRLENKR